MARGNPNFKKKAEIDPENLTPEPIEPVEVAPVEVTDAVIMEDIERLISDFEVMKMNRAKIGKSARHYEHGASDMKMFLVRFKKNTR